MIRVQTNHLAALRYLLLPLHTAPLLLLALFSVLLLVGVHGGFLDLPGYSWQVAPWPKP